MGGSNDDRNRAVGLATVLFENRRVYLVRYVVVVQLGYMGHICDDIACVYHRVSYAGSFYRTKYYRKADKLHFIALSETRLSRIENNSRWGYRLFFGTVLTDE